MSPQAALERILEIMGGAEPLAAELGIDRNNIYIWKRKGVPKKQVTPVLAAARRHVRKLSRLPTRRELCPDLTPKPRGAGRGKPNGEPRGKKKIICKTRKDKGGGKTPESQAQP